MFDIFLQLFVTSIILASIYALVALGLTLIFGVLEIVNFAHGEFLMLGMYGSYLLAEFFNFSPYISILIILIISFLLGFAIEKTLIAPVINRSFTIQISITLGISLIIKNGILLIYGPSYRVIKSNLASKVISFANIYFTYGQLLAFIISIALILISFLILRYTYTGKAIRAVSQNRVAAMLLGVNVSFVYAVTFGIGIALTGAAGVLLSPLLTAVPHIGSIYVIIAFIIVILGGPKNIVGTLMGSVIIAFTEVLTSYFLTPHLKDSMIFMVFIVVLLFRPEGIFTKRISL